MLVVAEGERPAPYDASVLSDVDESDDDEEAAQSDEEEEGADGPGVDPAD